MPLIVRDLAELEFGLTPVASNWHLHLPQGQASAYKGSSIDHGLSADAIEASAILKLRPPNSLEKSTCYAYQPKLCYSTGCVISTGTTFGASTEALGDLTKILFYV